jgi:protein gp37
MGELTGIPWCHHTFNPWWGCVEVSPGCDHCYAREDARRYGHGVWGQGAPRRFFSDKHWDEPIQWNRRVREAGERRRVFCASMADVGEERSDGIGRKLDQARQRLWVLITNTEGLDWLLLTKRPAGLRRLLPPEILALPNVWLGVTVENADYTWRVDELRKIPCPGPLWISYEPALGPVDFAQWLPEVEGRRRRAAESAQRQAGPAQRGGDPPETGVREPRLSWILVGGESGPGARPFNVSWARAVIAQCKAAGVPVFVKQLGALPFEELPDGRFVLFRDASPSRYFPDYDGHDYLVAKTLCRDRKGGDPAEWEPALQVREYPL